MAKLTRAEWDAMTADEQWKYVNRAPFQIGELVKVKNFIHNNVMTNIESFIGRVDDASLIKGVWVFDVREDEPEEIENGRWVCNWPVHGLEATKKK